MNSQLVLSSEGVNAVFMQCLFKEGEDKSCCTESEGIIHNVCFHSKRLKDRQVVIETMLNELPDQFQELSGGGWSFLNACDDKHGRQWTGLHLHMEQLFLLGIGINRVKSLFSKDMWNALPGSMPYYVVTKSMEGNNER
jgi:hypothetical protein